MAASTWAQALTTIAGYVNSAVQVQPVAFYTGQTGTTSVPTDANPPPSLFGIAGAGNPDNQMSVNGQTGVGSWTPPVGSIRVDGWKQVALSLEVYGSSGTVTATFQPFFWDFSRWVQCADAITLTMSATSDGPAARQRHDIVVENDFGLCIQISAISGTGATASAWATLRDPILVRR